jgi:hypothetical protein
VDRAGTWVVVGVRTEYFLFVYALDGLVVRVARRKWLLKRITQVVVAGYQVVKQARAAITASMDRRIAAAGRQIGGADDRRISIVLVVHGCECVRDVAKLMVAAVSQRVWRGGKGKVQSSSAPSLAKMHGLGTPPSSSCEAHQQPRAPVSESQ